VFGHLLEQSPDFETSDREAISRLTNDTALFGSRDRLLGSVRVENILIMLGAL